jgi:type VI protein secretion system component VasK
MPRVQASAVEEGQAAAVLTAQEAAIQRRRFDHVCSLIARAREPVCPVNGVVALVPYEAVQVNPREAEGLQRALHGDLQTILKRLRLRCTVTVLFTGLERERGFSELVRRVGQQRAQTQRFGRGFDVASLATKEELAAFALHVCGAFEDWIYTLFREHGALSRPGNTHLFNLLCRVRFNLKSRLTDLLAEGLGYDGDAASEERLLVSGCYFAATGNSPDRQAFVKSVFDKLEEEQEAVEWTPSAQREFRLLKWLTWTGIGVAGILLALAIGMIIQRFYRA